MAPPSQPSAPAFETAATSAGVEAPAIGAWTIGWTIFRRSSNRRSGHMACVSCRCRGTSGNLRSDAESEAVRHAKYDYNAIDCAIAEIGFAAMNRPVIPPKSRRAAGLVGAQGGA